MLNPTTTAIVSRISECVAIDCETMILPVVRLPLVTANCHKVIKEQDASLRAAQQDVHVKTLVITELDGVVTALQENLEELKGEYEDAASNVRDLLARMSAYERDMEGTLKSLEDARRANLILLEMSEEAERDAAKNAAKVANLDDILTCNARDMSILLDKAHDREDHMHETIIGVRAFAESDALSDHEKVALILRLIK